MALNVTNGKQIGFQDPYPFHIHLQFFEYNIKNINMAWGLSKELTINILNTHFTVVTGHPPTRPKCQ